MLQDDDITPLGEVPDCEALDHPNPDYAALDLCLENADADAKCPDNSYGVMVVEDNAVNAWNEKLKAFKVCGWCPAGEHSITGQDCPPGLGLSGPVRAGQHCASLYGSLAGNVGTASSLLSPGCKPELAANLLRLG
jgi:hypothetical protein